MKNKVSWVIAAVLALAFFGDGVFKLTGSAMMVAEFQSFGYPTAFMYFTGALEIVAAVLVLIPRFAALGAGLITCIMAGALYSHLTHGQALYTPPVLVLLVLALVLGWLRNWSLPFATRGAVGA
jgi:putative oxidoreductase